MPPSAAVIMRFCGLTKESENLDSLLSSLLSQLYAVYDRDWALPSSAEQLRGDTSVAFNLATAEKPLVLVLDSMETLIDSGNIRGLWLPEALPKHCKIILTIQDNCNLVPGFEKRWGKNVFSPLAALTQQQAKG